MTKNVPTGRSASPWALAFALAGFAVASPGFGAGSDGTIPKSVDATTGGRYVIGAGDVLQIDVWKEPEASVASIAVRSDGVITVPLLRELPVAGMTTGELEKLLTEKYSKLIRDANVSVIVKEIHSEKIYLIGAVRKEGSIVMKSPLNVLQAIAESGGLTDYAKRSKIYILRGDRGHQERIPFDYEAVLKGQKIEQNIVLRPGDTVVVPQ